MNKRFIACALDAGKYFLCLALIAAAMAGPVLITGVVRSELGLTMG